VYTAPTPGAPGQACGPAGGVGAPHPFADTWGLPPSARARELRGACPRARVRPGHGASPEHPLLPL